MSNGFIAEKPHYPAYKMLDRPATPIETLHRGRKIGKAAGLRYVYLGNVPGDEAENTYCYQCGTLLIERCGFLVRSNRIENACCPQCDAPIDGVGLSSGE